MDTLYAIAMNTYNHHTTQSPFDRSTLTPRLNLNPTPDRDLDPSDGPENPDHYDSVLKFLNQMLMEEDDLQDKPCTYNERMALQVEAAEKLLYNVLVNKEQDSPDSSAGSGTFSRVPATGNCHDSAEENVIHLLQGSNLNSSKKRSPNREEEPETKITITISDLESDQPDRYDEALLLCDYEPQESVSIELAKRKNESSKRGRPKGKNRTNHPEILVDLRHLLTQCAQAITDYDHSSVSELLNKIKQHCTPNGDSMERLAHYLVKAIEARLAGTGHEMYRAPTLKKAPSSHILKAYHSYLKARPFHRMSTILANGSIEKLSRGKDKLHIIDFGILFGFQWLCFIKNLSTRPGGPPTLQITGIDFPQPGFRPAERVEETGRRLTRYCKRFNVPFKFIGIAKNWVEIKIEDLELDRSELTIVNLINRLRTILDGTVVESSPRDTVLRLIRAINPDMFVVGILNGTHYAPFLLNRFREALYHFSTLFDMFDNTADRQCQHRLMYEHNIFGREIMNVVACEGSTRVERPETYKQWGSRITRAGFRQVALFPEKVEEAKSKVKSNCHRDYLVDEDGKWVLQGWKGRVLYASSLWKPA